MGMTNFGAVKALLGASYRQADCYRYVFDKFSARPSFVDDDGDGAPTGSTGDVNIMVTEDARYEYHMKGAGQTIVKPVWASTGLDIGLDQTDDEGVEITQGITALSKGYFTARTDECFFRVKFNIADVSGTDDCAIGFRKAEAYQANIDDYDEMACINVISGDIKIETILNNAATTTTDTTQNWADGETHTLEVRVQASGAVTYVIDGAAPTATAAFSFDSAEKIVPFFFFLNAADIAGAVNILEWECGTFDTRGLTSATDYSN